MKLIRKNPTQVNSLANGQKKEEINYTNGKEDGLSTEWYENGRKILKEFT